jgi:hypothetical protein
MDIIFDLLIEIKYWSNKNEGFLALLIFIFAILFGWLSGIFKALRKRPKFLIDLIEGPTLCCTFYSGRKYNGYNAHRTAISLYIKVTNVGKAASSIDNIQVGYHNNTLKYKFFWFWLDQVIALKDFNIVVDSDNIKVYPFFIQKNHLGYIENNTYLNIGLSKNGAVYFEQAESWGGFKPKIVNGFIKLKVRVKDAFGKYHTRVFKVPNVSLQEARKYNESFGLTLENIQGCKSKG